MQFNTAVSELMKLNNAMGSDLGNVGNAVAQEALRIMLVLLAPFAPHIADELWEQLGGTGSVHSQSWPEPDASALVRETISVVLQVKGKVRGQLEVPANTDAKELERLALASKVAQKWLEGTSPKRVIVVPGRLVNLVP
jgi:leucyl-tRNA synthetase